MTLSRGYAAQSKASALAPYQFERREPGERDVLIDILYCGVCHSDIHQARNEWGNSIYPMVPGHEIVGKIVKVGSKVTQFKVGDIAGVGCLVDACRTCSSCKTHLEQYCEKGWTGTYNSLDKDGKTPTFGGYSNNIVVDEAFTLKIPSTLALSQVAPLLCAGITTYSPLKHWKVGPGQKIGIIGLGGLGHMAVKIAHAMGAKVVVFTTSPSKVDDAKRFGADEVVISKNEREMLAHTNSFDILLNTVCAEINLGAYTALLKREGTLVLVGLPNKAPAVPAFDLVMRRKNIAGSLIGGIKETQEMLDFCAKHEITSDVEVISIKEINTAYERMIKGDVKYRFVIDMSSLK